MQTTSTGSPKVKKTTSTAVKRKAKALDKAIDAHNKKSFEGSWEELIEVPVLRKIKPEEPPTNYWKWACIAILLGMVAGMILSTPTIISMFDACVQ